MIASTDSPGNDRRRRVRHIARRLLPPVLADLIRARRDPGPSDRPEWAYLKTGWPTGRPAAGGWETEALAASERAHWPNLFKALDGPGPMRLVTDDADDADRPGRPSEADYSRHNSLISFGYVLARAARDTARISMLDWGGGAGRYRLYARALVPEVELDYHCRDLPFLLQVGRDVLPDGVFHDDDASALARSYDLVLASSSLQYLQDWRTVLAALAAVTERYLFVTRQPFVASGPSFVVAQRPPYLGFPAEFVGWFLNRDEFLDEARGLGLVLEREFLIIEHPWVAGAPVQGDYRGFLFSVARERPGP